MNKKKIIIFGVFLLLLVVGTTFAFFQTNFLGIKNVSVVTPKIELTYKEKTNAISVSDAKSDEVGKTSSYFEFDVEAFSSIPYDIFYLIYLTEQNSTLSGEYVKVYLTKVENNVETEVVAPTYINKLKEYALADNSRSLYRKASFNLPGDETITHTYRLRAWITDEKPVKIEGNKVTNGDTTNIVVDSLTYNFTVNVATKEATLEGNLSSSWKNYTTDEAKFLALYTLDTKDMPETYEYNNTIYTLESGVDVSEQQNGSVILGTYSDGTNKIALMGQDEGVIAPVNSANLFSNLSKVIVLNLENFNTSNVANMSRMFNNCSSFTTLDLSNFNTSQVTDMSYMFYDCNNLVSLNLSSFDTVNVTNMSYMFGSCMDLTSLDLSNFDTSNVTNMSSMFSNCSSFTTLDLSSFNTSNVTNMSSMFSNCSSFTTLDLSSFNTSQVTDMSYMFNGCSGLTTLDLSSFNTSNTTNMSGMFNGCSGLTSLNLSNFNTSNVTNMSSMFSNCSSLTSLDLSSFDTLKVTSMLSMFNNCRSLTTLDLSSFNTSNVTNISFMFEYCRSLTSLDLSSFNTSNVTNMSSMFKNCEKLISLDLSNFNTLNVTDMSRVFRDCVKLISLDLSSFNTLNVTDMSQMFYNCNKLTSLDLSSFDTSNVTSMVNIFYNCYLIIEAYARSTQDATKLNASSSKPTTWNFVSVAPIVEVTIDNQSSDLVSITMPEGDVIEGGVSKYTLVPVQENKVVTSFKLNGKTIGGNTFVAPLSSSTVTISDVVLVDPIIIESEHNPYPNNLNSVVYGEASFDNATSLTVVLDYQTQSTSYDWIYLYDANGNIVNNKKYGGTTRKTETITVSGNYVKIVFRTNASTNNYYGFHATVTPNY